MGLTKKAGGDGGDAGLRGATGANARTAEPVPELEWDAAFGEFLRSICPGARNRSGAKWTELYAELVDSIILDAGPGGRTEGTDGGGRAVERLGIDKEVVEKIKAVMGGDGRAMESESESEARDRIGRRVDELFECYVEEKYGKDAWERLNRRVDEFFRRLGERLDEEEEMLNERINEDINERLDEYINEGIKRRIEERFEESLDERIKSQIKEEIDRQIMVENFKTFRREYMRMDILRSC